MTGVQPCPDGGDKAARWAGRRCPWQALWLLSALALLTATGCVSVPAQRSLMDDGFTAQALAPASITVTSWNIKKTKASGWPAYASQGTAAKRFGGIDLLLLQEACEPLDEQHDPLGKPLADARLGWAFATSFESRLLGCGGQRATGVLTASSARPVSSIGLLSQNRELGITPKSTLVTRYRLANRADTLLVVNTHLLNFEWRTLDDYSEQVRAIGEAISAHRGPVILAGDLNTRNAARQAVVDRMADEHGLKPVFGQAAAGRTKAIVGGDLALDHIYYRGLHVIKEGVVGHESDTDISDHNSLSVGFAVDPGIN